MEVTTADAGWRRSRALRWTAFAAGATLVLLWLELFLTAQAEEPNTWEGVVTDTVVLFVAIGVGFLLIVVGSSRDAGVAALIGLGLTALAAIPFWTGAATVLGVATAALALPERRIVAGVAGVLAALVAVFLVVETVINFAPGLPA